MNRIRFSSPRELLLFVFLSIAGCGGGGESSSSSPPTPTPQPPVNRAPTVNAGTPQSAQGGGIVLLQGSASDPDGDMLTYTWAQTAGPQVTIKNASLLKASFDAPVMAGTVSFDFELQVTDARGMSTRDSTNILVSSGFTPCTPTTPPTHLNLDPFYKKYCDANGIPVVSSDKVQDRALEWVRYQTLEMSKFRPDVVAAMIQNRSRVAIIARTEVFTDIPEYSDLPITDPSKTREEWSRLRGGGGVPGRPVSSTAEENVMCDQNDPYGAFSIFVHEFAHGMDRTGLRFADATFELRLRATYDETVRQGRWIQNNGLPRYSRTNIDEYWADGATIFLNVYAARPPVPPNSTPYMRAELASYDPALYGLLREAFPEMDLARCPP